jgi:hypothetical protein
MDWCRISRLAEAMPNQSTGQSLHRVSDFINLLCIIRSVDVPQRRFNLSLGEHRVVSPNFFRDVFFVVLVELLDGFVVFDYLKEHVNHAKAKNVVFVVGISDFRYCVVQNVVTHLMVEVVVRVFVELLQVGEFRNLEEN